MMCARDYANLASEDRVAETNIIELSLSCLKNETSIATGEAIFCNYCKSILNSLSILNKSNNRCIWVCEFCDYENTLELEEKEIPIEPELTYILEPEVQMAQFVSESKSSGGIIFCIDISGSMCVSQPVEGKLNLKTCRIGEMQKLLIPGLDDQNFDEENITYVSRLECVQAAIENQLNVLAASSPELRVGLVAFSGEVRVIGDGINEEIVTGDRLYDLDELKNWSNSRKQLFLQKSVSENLELLKQKVIGLEESGPTALGPALLISVILASAAGVGSKVIICTDGLANIGIGSLEPGTATNYYDVLADLATELGVSVSIISIEGEECRLESLIGVIEKTGGEVNRVAPDRISEEFSNILSNEVLATKVEIQITLHKSVEFKNEDQENLTFGNSRLEKVIGNAISNSSFSFAFNLKSQEVLNTLDVQIDKIHMIPFQAIIKYVNLQGKKFVRVINKQQLVANDRNESENMVNMGILARAGRRQAARLAEQGRINEAQNVLNDWKKEIIQSASRTELPEAHEVECFMVQAEKFEREIEFEVHKRISSTEKASMDFIHQQFDQLLPEDEEKMASLQTENKKIGASDRYVNALSNFKKHK